MLLADYSCPTCIYGEKANFVTGYENFSTNYFKIQKEVSNMKKFIEAMFLGALLAYVIGFLFSVDVNIVGFFLCGLIARYLVDKFDTKSAKKNKHFAN